MSRNLPAGTRLPTCSAVRKIDQSRRERGMRVTWAWLDRCLEADRATGRTIAAKAADRQRDEQVYRAENVALTSASDPPAASRSGAANRMRPSEHFDFAVGDLVLEIRSGSADRPPVHAHVCFNATHIDLARSSAALGRRARAAAFFRSQRRDTSADANRLIRHRDLARPVPFGERVGDPQLCEYFRQRHQRDLGAEGNTVAGIR